MATLIAIRASEPVEVNVVGGGADLIAEDGPFTVSMLVPSSPPCSGCEAQPVRTFTIDPEQGIMGDTFTIAHLETCPVAYCPHGKLRTNVDDPCAICAAGGGA